MRTEMAIGHEFQCVQKQSDPRTLIHEVGSEPLIEV